MEKNKWDVFFEENGGEYVGCLTVTAKTLLRIDEKTIEVDGVLIEIDERITDIRKE